MNDSWQSPWPAIIKIALLIGCTMGFCVLGLISGVLAAKVMQHASDVRGDELLVTVLMPPVVGALFGFFVGMVSTLYVRWSPRKPFGQPPLQPLAQPPVSTPSSQAPPPR
jgi:uncharacterized integral membrane protein